MQAKRNHCSSTSRSPAVCAFSRSMLFRMPTVLASSQVTVIARVSQAMDHWFSLDKSTRERCMISGNPGYFEAQTCGGCFASQSVVLLVASRTAPPLSWSLSGSISTGDSSCQCIQLGWFPPCFFCGFCGYCVV